MFFADKIVRYVRAIIRLGGEFPNDAYITGVPKNIVAAVGAGNVGTGLDTLFSFTFPATSLKQDFANFRATFAGVVGSNDDNKRLTVDFGGTQLMDTGLVDIDAWGFLLTVFGMRFDATHIGLQTTLNWGNINIDSAGGIASNGIKLFSTNAHSLVVNNMDTASNDLIIKGESATATNNNVFNSFALIDLVRF